MCIRDRGTAFLEVDGYAVEYNLAPGEQMVVDTGNLAMCDATCSIDIQAVRGVKNVLFGGEGLFHKMCIRDSNLPTLVFCAVYRSTRRKYVEQRGVDRMNIQDL